MVIIINSSRIRGKIDHFEGIFIITGLTCLILSFLGFAMGSFNGKLLKLKRFALGIEKNYECNNDEWVSGFAEEIELLLLDM